jgi:phosphoribosylformylglycinamidine synthase
VVSVAPDHVEAVLEGARQAGVSAEAIGTTGGDRIRVAVAGAGAIDCAVAGAEQAWATAIERRMC